MFMVTRRCSHLSSCTNFTIDLKNIYIDLLLACTDSEIVKLFNYFHFSDKGQAWTKRKTRMLA